MSTALNQTRYTKFTKEHGYAFALVLIAIISHLQWFNPQSTLFFHDWRHRNDSVTEEFTNFGWTTWLSATGLGEENIQLYLFPQTYIWGLIGDYDLAVKITLLWPIALLSFLAPYFLLRRHVSPPVAFLGALVYGANTYLLQRSNAHILISLVYSLAPFILLALARFVDRPTIQTLLPFLLLYSVGIFYEIRVMYIVTLALFIYVITHAARKKQMRRVAIFTIPAFMLIVALHVFWLIPTLTASVERINEVANRGLWGSEFLNLQYALALFDWHWTGGEYEQEFIPQPIKLFAWIIPLVATLSIFQFPRETRGAKRVIVFFGIILFTGFLLAKQEAPPFTDLYAWLYENFPGFNLFREASKFYLLIALGYAGLFAFGVKFLSEKFASSTSILSAPATKLVAYGVLVVLLLLPLRPLVTQEIGGLFVNRSVPQNYKKLEQLIRSEHDDYFRTLWIPFYHQFGYYDHLHPKVSYWHELAETQGFVKFSNVPKTISRFQQPTFYTNVFDANYGESMLDLLAVKYVIIPAALPESSGERIFPYAGNRGEFVIELKHVPGLIPHKIGNINAYENKDYKPYIHTSNTLLSFRDFEKLEEKYAFTSEALGKEFVFVSDEETRVHATRVSGVFEQIVPGHISPERIELTASTSPQTILYTPLPRERISMEDDTVVFSAAPSSAATTAATSSRPAIATSTEATTTPQAAETPQAAGAYTRLPLPSAPETTFRYEAADGAFVNLVATSSFEAELWEEQVGDCNNYDDLPILDMRQANVASDGEHSLELVAARHIACTDQQLEVAGGATYLLAFDYQSPNGEEAGYHLGFANRNATTTQYEPARGQIPVEDETWHTYTRIIETPATSTHARLHLYSYAKDETTPIITRYDNVHLVRLPEDIFDHWLVTEPSRELVAPRKTEFEIINPTKKRVHIEGATTPFYLMMSESYHEKWRLAFDNEEVRGFFNSWVPWANADAIPQEEHFKLNGFLNGWYVDTDKLCAGDATLCTQNADGSYDLDLVIEFTPQRWFYLGLLISGTTLAGCLLYLLYAFMRRSSRRKRGTPPSQSPRTRSTAL